MDLSTLFTFFLALIKVISSTPITTLASSSPVSSSYSAPLYQPALIGFRCEGAQEVTPDGISVIEANTPVKLTLFGESFTPDTIVAFTTEFSPPLDTVNRVIESNLNDPENISELVVDQRDSSVLTGAKLTSDITTSASITVIQDTTILPTENNRPKSVLTTNSKVVNQRKFANRKRYLSKSYDCTDYNRVTSYKLTSDDIITPNVAVLTIILPELDESISGRYYYFCLKQPALPASTVGFVTKEDNDNGDGDPSSKDRYYLQYDNANYANLHHHQNQNETLVWVHQGDDWWLTIKVEPPILSVANDCILIILLLFLSAITSGLNLGLMSLDMNELAVISSCGDQRERNYARTIAPVRKRGNYLLCSLLLGNVMVNSTLTVILEEMTSGVVAVIGSTLAIVILGEIVPQAFCSRQGLAIGAKTIYLTYAFMILTFPLSYPISCLLDCVLGEEKGNVYDRERLMEFIKITGHHTQLEADEVAIISGALKLKKIKVDQIMTKIEDVFMLPIDCMLNRDTIKRIIEKGYSRIPIYEFGDRKQIVALILAKDLALLDPDDQMPLANMLMYCKHPLIFIEDSATLDVALNEFKTGKSHMAVVRQIYDDGEVDKYYEAIGIVTLEDVIEEVLQTEINDETDTLSDNRRKRRRTDAQVAHLFDGEPLAECSATMSSSIWTSSASTNTHTNHYSANHKLESGPLSDAGVTGQHQRQHHHQSICMPRGLATCQHIVMSLLSSLEERFRSFMVQIKQSVNRMFISCLTGGGHSAGGVTSFTSTPTRRRVSSRQVIG